MEGRSSKRAKTSHAGEVRESQQQVAFAGPDFIDFSSTYWPDAFAANNNLPRNEPFYFGHDFGAQQASSRPAKRRRDNDEDDAEVQEYPQDDNALSQFEYHRPTTTGDGLIKELFPELFAQAPSLEDRRVTDIMPNPFINGKRQILARYDASRRQPTIVPTDGQINGYVKFTFRPGSVQSRTLSEEMPWTGLAQQDMGVHHRNLPVLSGIVPQKVPLLPANFGSASKLDLIDRQLLTFYEAAFCAGRTLLPKTNPYLDIMTMTDTNEGVRHCALALAAGYILDYVPSDTNLRSRANHHYHRAVELLTDSLSDPSIQEVGKEDSTVGCLVLLFSEDIVNWELRNERNVEPAWRKATRRAKMILDNSDPGYRYWKTENVQSSRIRASNANMVAYAEICALPVTPLEITDTDKLYSWLLEGSENDVHQIHGASGVSPKLLHIYAQITQLSARMEKNPDSVIIPLAAEEVESRLESFKQWSEISPGFHNVHELLDACVLDDKGLVQDAPTVTDLTGESWVQAAKIYLYGRFFRLPRNDNKIQESLRLLLRCVERMPTCGELFTAQSPFFCIVMAAFVACREEDRNVIRNWFKVIVGAASPRSSVPPIWRVVQEFWTWSDEENFALPSAEVSVQSSLSQRDPWWETMVSRFMGQEGLICLV